MATLTWQEIVADKKKRQAATIPQEWIISVPGDDVLDVTDVPAKSGLLSAKELEITDGTDVGYLLQKLASGEWSAVEVTTAYSKRAIIAHQVVNGLPTIMPSTLIITPRLQDELPDRDLHRSCSCSGSVAR